MIESFADNSIHETMSPRNSLYRYYYQIWLYLYKVSSIARLKTLSKEVDLKKLGRCGEGNHSDLITATAQQP